MNHVAMLTVNLEFTSLFQDLLDNTASVIYVKDIEFRYLLINQQFETLFHVSRHDILGKTDFDLFPTERAEAFRKNDLHVIETGETLQCEEIAPQDDGPHSYFSLKFPLRDASGTIYAMAGISTDITDRLRAQREIASFQDRERLLMESVGDGICGLDPHGKIAYLNPAAERMLQWTSAELRGTCHSRIVVPRRSASNLPAESEPSPIAAALNGKLATQVQGALFRRRDGSVMPVEYTVATIDDLGTRIAAVIAFRDTTDRLRQLETEQEMQTARRIQNSLIPRRPPVVDGIEIAAISDPCSRACGDYFDFIPWGEHRLGIAVGDVSGHGLGAALEMVETRAILRTTMIHETDPVACLTRLNQFLSEDLPDDMFVTLLLASLDTQSRSLTYCSAGHDAILLTADNQVSRLESTGAALGLNAAAVYSAGVPVTLRQGDLLLIATDGLSESVSPAKELFGRQRIADLLRIHRKEPASQILDALRVAAAEFRGTTPQRDDLTAVLLKVH